MPDVVIPETTPAQGNADAGQNQVDWEKRYKDLQSESTRVMQAKADLERENERLLSQRSQPVAEPSPDDVLPVDRQQLNKTVESLRRERELDRAFFQFRIENPDLKEYEGIADHFYQTKTDPRKQPTDRVREAAQKTREFLESERQRGAASVKKPMEAAVGNLSGQAPAATKPEQEEKGQTYDEYMKERAEARRKKMAY